MGVEDRMRTDHIMTVAQLRDLLAGLPPDLPVVMSKDAEGNDYSPLPADDRSDVRHYVPRTTWAGDVLHPDDLESGWSTVPEDSFEALVLWPVN